MFSEIPNYWLQLRTWKLILLQFCRKRHQPLNWDHGPIKIPIQSESSTQDVLISRVLWQKRLCLNQPDSTDVVQWSCGMQKMMMKQWVAVDCDCEFHKYGMKRIQWDHGPGNTLYAHNRMFEKIEDSLLIIYQWWVPGPWSQTALYQVFRGINGDPSVKSGKPHSLQLPDFKKRISLTKKRNQEKRSRKRIWLSVQNWE